MSPRRAATYVDRHGRPISHAAWLALSARPRYVEIASDSITLGGGDAHITTIWLGIVLPGPGPPPVFQTLAHFAGSSRPVRWTWCTLAQARTGHVEVITSLVTGEFAADSNGCPG
jgi:hypothetical protein